MLPNLPTKEIKKDADKLSPAIFAFIIKIKAIKTCGCIEDQAKQKLCYEKFR